MKKKLLSLLLASCMVVSLAACGGKTDGGSASTGDGATADGGDATEAATGVATPAWDEYDALIQEIKTTTDFAKRVDLMHQAEDKLMETFAVIPIYYYNDLYMQKANVDGIYANAYGFKYFQAATKTGSSDDKTLFLNLASEPDYLDPALNSSVDGACLAIASFSGLMEYDKDGKTVPAVAAEAPSVSDDGTEWTIKLKETKWSNGDALTANDFVYSWNRAVADETAADYAYMFDVIARGDDDKLAVEAVDDYTLKITLTNPCPYFESLLAFPAYFPVHQASVEAANPNGDAPGAWCQEAGFVSNGPYTCTAWKHDESMTYEKNPNFYDADKVTMDKLQFMLSADDTAIYAAYNNGDLDFIDTVPTDEIQSLKDNKEFHIIDNLGTYYLAFNVKSDLFDGLTEQQANDFRHAICLLIDRDYIVETVGQCEQVLADSYIPEGMSDGNGGMFKNKSYYDATTTDVEQAKELLEGCGYTFTDNGDGTYTPDKTISIPYIINESSGHQAIAECVQSDLAVLGIEMTITSEDWNVFLQDRKDGNYTFAREGWLADFDDPINMLEMFTTDSGNNDPQFGR